MYFTKCCSRYPPASLHQSLPLDSAVPPLNPANPRRPKLSLEPDDCEVNGFYHTDAPATAPLSASVRTSSINHSFIHSFAPLHSVTSTADATATNNLISIAQRPSGTSQLMPGLSLACAPLLSPLSHTESLQPAVGQGALSPWSFRHDLRSSSNLRL